MLNSFIKAYLQASIAIQIQLLLMLNILRNAFFASFLEIQIQLLLMLNVQSLYG